MFASCVATREPHIYIAVEATAPVKLPAYHCSYSGLRSEVRIPTKQGWYFTVGSTEASAPASKPSTYSTHALSEPNSRVQ